MNYPTRAAILFICIVSLAGSYGCSEPPAEESVSETQGAKQSDSEPKEGSLCFDSCMSARMEEFSTSRCYDECAHKREQLDLDTSACDELCASAVRSREQLAGLKCKSDCVDQSDGDSVTDSLDRCPDTPAGVPVTWDGCPDGDGDGVADKQDACPGTASGTDVTVDGCDVVAACSQGKCETAQPTCSSEQACDRQREIPLLESAPLATRQEWIMKFLKRRHADIACPDDETAPPQPQFLQPEATVEPVQVGQASVSFTNGAVTSGTVVPLEFVWEEVSDPCEPVEYSIYLEYYYCDTITGVEELHSYRNQGWCRWMPLEYQTVPTLSYDFQFAFGEHLYRIHQPFSDELLWNPPSDGTFYIGYRPFWLRVRLMAHDGNANTSAFGVHERHHYLVLYQKAALSTLSQIPVAP
ncbi:hypothetical protein FIV42_21585 [Persicimonas caeni]|uniref:Uncharacterized protein n=1 Tax=Persicimonas caeni TaxID=2292766 RepID=A0A4Y6PYB1_PERCE|nr:hypothetical protein [Persicimonas caeni]QDG53243.1 hypothetical protein FIV42_21585 [Persicimonas caeni]QED34465.1 hypothetical protein FRD00_21580 [Persicimonas caeni]